MKTYQRNFTPYLVALAFTFGVAISGYLTFEATNYVNDQETHKQAIQHFCGSYDPQTGVFAWKHDVNMPKTEEVLASTLVKKVKK